MSNTTDHHGHHQDGEAEKTHSHAKKVVTIRSHSGLSGDMLLAGLAVLALQERKIEPQSAQGRQWLNEQLGKISPQLDAAVQLALKPLNGIGGWNAQVNLPEEKKHRTLSDIEKIIIDSRLGDQAKALSLASFRLLAECEAFAHGSTPDKIHFHEVGALDSILDMCGVCLLHELLGSPDIICSPLPMCDGEIHCMHGALPAPAPAVLRLLQGFFIKPFQGAMNAGELLTPTAAALLHALPVSFGPWPSILVESANLVYGNKVFANVPNGAIFAQGKMYA